MIKTAKEVVELISKKKKLKSTKERTYCLTHIYDEKPRNFWVLAPYSLEVFETICAYIQYECSDIEQSYGMSQEDIVKALEQLYECKAIETPRAGRYYKVDLYENWEIYCGQAGEVQKIETLKREGLRDLLEEFVESFYLEKPEWRPKEVNGIGN